MSALLIALGILVALVVALRVRSLIRPEPFPPWMTPMLEGRLRRLFFDRERTHRGGCCMSALRVDVDLAGVTCDTRIPSTHRSS